MSELLLLLGHLRVVLLPFSVWIWPGWITSKTPPTNTTFKASLPKKVSLSGLSFSSRPLEISCRILSLNIRIGKYILDRSMSIELTLGSMLLTYTAANKAFSKGSIRLLRPLMFIVSPIIFFSNHSVILVS